MASTPAKSNRIWREERPFKSIYYNYSFKDNISFIIVSVLTTAGFGSYKVLYIN